MRIPTVEAEKRYQPVHRFELDGATIAVIVGGLVAVVTAFFTGLWPWLTGRKKGEIDAQSALIANMLLLFGTIQKERDRLIERLTDCESEGEKQDRRIAKQDRRILKLEHILIKNGFEIPENES